MDLFFIPNLFFWSGFQWCFSNDFKFVWNNIHMVESILLVLFQKSQGHAYETSNMFSHCNCLRIGFTLFSMSYQTITQKCALRLCHLSFADPVIISNYHLPWHTLKRMHHSPRWYQLSLTSSNQDSLGLLRTP